jgi:hypothetical protein
MKRQRTSQDAFSLVEVVFALGVATFCLLPILALLPIGLTTNQNTLRDTTAAGLAVAVTDDLRATPAATVNSYSPRYGLVVPPAGGLPFTNTVYLTEDSSVPTPASQPSATQATYLATVVVTPSVLGTLNAATARILITWPAQAHQVAGSIPTNYMGSFETVIGLPQN